MLFIFKKQRENGKWPAAFYYRSSDEKVTKVRRNAYGTKREKDSHLFYWRYAYYANPKVFLFSNIHCRYCYIICDAAYGEYCVGKGFSQSSLSLRDVFFVVIILISVFRFNKNFTERRIDKNFFIKTYDIIWLYIRLYIAECYLKNSIYLNLITIQII